MSDKKGKGGPIFTNFWGWKFNRISLIIILIVFLAMASMKMCDSPYIKKSDPDAIKIIPR